MSKLGRYSDRVELVNWRRCECGNVKSSGSEGCRRCVHLDGHRRSADVIRALRGTDGLSVNELCVAVHGHVTDGNYTTMARTVTTMLGHKRLRRYQQDVVHDESSGWSKGKGGYTSWVYALDGRTEDGR